MLKSLSVRNFTVFGDEQIDFCPGLNVLVRENATGKTHLLKLAYSLLVTTSAGRGAMQPAEPTKDWLQRALAEKLCGVFGAEGVGRLVRRRRGRERCEVEAVFGDGRGRMALSFATNSRSEVTVELPPSCWAERVPVYLPTRELLTIYPGFVPLYDSRHLEFEATWRDTCVLLGSPALRGPREGTVARLLEPLERAMGGIVVLDAGGRYYLDTADHGRLELPLVAEGHRKLAMLARLIATGSLLDQGCLFWDEPEANLNPRLIRDVAATIMDLSSAGLQVFIATHSLYQLRELDILLRGDQHVRLTRRFVGLSPGDDGRVALAQGDSVDGIGAIASLEAELEQADRYLETD